MDYNILAQLARKGATKDQIAKFTAAGLSLAEIQGFYGVDSSPATPPQSADIMSIVKSAVQEAVKEVIPQNPTPAPTADDFSQMFARTFPNADVPPDRDVQAILNERFAGLMGGDGNGGKKNG